MRGCHHDVPLTPCELFDDVLAVDAGSTDGTTEYLSEHGIRVVAQSARSYNAAYIETFANYQGDAIVFFHPKGTVDHQSLVDVVIALKDGNDFLVASRMLPESKIEEDSKLICQRKWFGQFLGVDSSLRWKHHGSPRLTDPLHSYAGCSRKLTDSLVLRKVGVTAD